ncbi:MAG: class I SAM-dependent methyltransferase [Acidobacteriota bacterium]
MDQAYARRYRQLYERHWWWRAREKVILAALRRRQPAGGWRTILDVGCGDGLFFERLSELGEVEGVEPEAALVSASSRHRHRIHLCPFDDSFLPGKRYSLILMLDVLEHLEDPAAALRHAQALLEPLGVLLATVPAFNLLWTQHDELNRHHSRYTKGSFRQLARAAGLRIDRETYFFYWTCPVKLAARLVERALGLRPRLPRVPPRWLNGSLYLLSRLEQRTLGSLPVPFGSSLLIVGGREPTG